MERFLEVEAEVIAHDLHPDYLSTRYALARPAAARVGVQHHHAHLAAVLAEHRIEEPAVGVVWDGTGFGTDGTAWGGELLWGDASGFERLATLRPIALAGGDRAIHEPWRLALALLDDAFDGAPPIERLALFRGRDLESIAILRAMIARGVNAPLARGVGRYFDAVGSIVLERPWSRYEGQIAMELNLLAEGAGRAQRGEPSSYPFAIDRSRSPWEIDLRPMVRQAIADLLGGERAERISACFHHTLVSATAEILRALPAETRRAPVVLGGGCFSNAFLVEDLLARLSDRRVLLPRQAPPGDGGIALGQAAVADAVVSKRGGVPCA
jgi:hydrogenase maturation protein HypF